MFALDSETQDLVLIESDYTALELTVNNHPGVMSQICGLFARRGYNVEGIVCVPVGGGDHSRIWLLVNKEQRLDQIVKQVSKLEDVLDVRQWRADYDAFVRQAKRLQSRPLRMRGSGAALR